MGTAAGPTVQRQNGLDTLRASAIILVFMYHYSVFVSGTDTFGWASDLGWMGVDLFFVLSGYLIAHPLLAGMVAGRELHLGRFYGRRALRTLPVFWFVLALCFLLPTYVGGKPPPPLWRFLTFTQNWKLPPGTAFSHAWSLCIEEQFYLVLPLLLLLGRSYGRRKREAWLLLGGLITIGIVTRMMLWLNYGRLGMGFLADYYPNVYYGTACRADEFLPGVALAMLRNLHPALWQRLITHGQRNLLLGVAAVGLMFWGMHGHYFIDGYGYGFFMTVFGYSLVAMAFVLLVLAALSPASWLARWHIPGAYTMAIWSYAFYLIHKPVAYMVQQAIKPLGVGDGVRLLVITLACLLASWLLHWCVERPFMVLRQRYLASHSGPRATVTTPLVAQQA